MSKASPSGSNIPFPDTLSSVESDISDEVVFNKSGWRLVRGACPFPSIRIHPELESIYPLQGKLCRALFGIETTTFQVPGKVGMLCSETSLEGSSDIYRRAW